MKKAAVVTGASSGIGLAISRMLVKNGYEVFGIARDFSKVHKEEQFNMIECDITDTEKITQILKKIMSENELYILINNAGMSESTPLSAYTEELYDKVIDLNVKGVFTCSKVAADYMEKQHSGVIINASSIVSITGQPAGFAYPASKFAVNGMTLSMARELGPKGIRVNAVAPGITETDMMKAVPKNVIEPMIAQIPLRRLGQPEDIANAFVFLASDEASYITGVVLSVDGMARA
mgnify:CR=1 FL=1